MEWSRVRSPALSPYHSNTPLLQPIKQVRKRRVEILGNVMFSPVLSSTVSPALTVRRTIAHGKEKKSCVLIISQTKIGNVPSQVVVNDLPDVLAFALPVFRRSISERGRENPCCFIKASALRIIVSISECFIKSSFLTAEAQRRRGEEKTRSD